MFFHWLFYLRKMSKHSVCSKIFYFWCKKRYECFALMCLGCKFLQLSVPSLYIFQPPVSQSTRKSGSYSYGNLFCCPCCHPLKLGFLPPLFAVWQNFLSENLNFCFSPRLSETASFLEKAENKNNSLYTKKGSLEFH